MKILVMGNDRGSLSTLTEAIESLGHTILTSYDSQQAWQALQTEAIQLVLSICSASENQEICQQIKRHPSERATYFIAVLSQDTKDSLLDSLKVGADDFLIMPLEPDELEARLQIAERTANTRDALLRSQAQAAQNSKLAAIGQLASSIAHELNTPLGAVGLALEGALNRSHDPDRVERKIGISLRAVHSMQSIVSQLLNYSNKGTTAEKRCDLAEVIEDTLRLVEPKLRKDGITIETMVKTTPTLAIPASALQQILINLLTNAADAALLKNSRGQTVTITTDSNETSAFLSVSDQGLGISEDIRERLFEPFFTTKPLGSGTGLGLSVVKKLLDKYEAGLEIVSEPGNDTVFRVSIPLKIGD